jgi:hypothetical protein
VSKAFKHMLALAMMITLITFGLSLFAGEAMLDVSFERPSTILLEAMEEEIEDPYDYDIDINDYPEYQLMRENSDLALYLDDLTHNIAVMVKTSGYVWFSTDPDYDGIDAVTGREHNEQTQNRIRSSISFRTTQFETISSDFHLLNERHEVTYQMTDQGFVMEIELTSSGISFDVIVEIDGGDLSVAVPFHSIEETNLRLQSIRVFPGFGMTTGDDMTGYLFIPDGAGALIRYTTQATGLAYNEYIYGPDQGYQTLSQERVQNQGIVPAHQNKAAVLGIVHGVKKHAFIATIEEGAYYAQIRAEAKSNVTKYFSNTFAFNYRLLYFRPTNNQGDGFRITSETMIENDVSMRYTFLSDQQADYVGMAKAYRHHLIDRGMTPKTAQLEVPLHIDFVGMDVTKGLFRNKPVVMTTYEDALTITKEIMTDVTPRLQVSYRAKQTDGAYVFGYNRTIGSKKDYQDLISDLFDNNIPLSFLNEYNFIPETNRNIAKQVGGNLMSLLSTSTVFSTNYLLDMIAIKDQHQKALEVMEADGFGLYADQTGTLVYSHLDAKRELIHRDVMAKTMIDYLEEVKEYHTVLKNPIEPMFPLVGAITEFPLSSSGYAYITDTVPFMAIAMSGLMDLFSEPLNFIANRDVYMLKMIEYGLYPSYVLTKEDTFMLRGSDDTETFSSEYRLWKPVITADYALIKHALERVAGEPIINHLYLGQSVYVTSYANGVQIAVNYSDQIQSLAQGDVPALGYLVWEV